MTINCIDKKGNIFPKEIKIFLRNGFTNKNKYRKIVSLGFPYEWEYDMLISSPAKDNIMWIDAMGRNHKNSPVFCNFKELMDISKQLISDGTTILETNNP